MRMYRLSSICILIVLRHVGAAVFLSYLAKTAVPTLEGPLSSSCCLCHQWVCPDCTSWGRWEGWGTYNKTLEREANWDKSLVDKCIDWLYAHVFLHNLLSEYTIDRNRFKFVNWKLACCDNLTSENFCNTTDHDSTNILSCEPPPPPLAIQYIFSPVCFTQAVCINNKLTAVTWPNPEHLTVLWRIRAVAASQVSLVSTAACLAMPISASAQ